MRQWVLVTSWEPLDVFVFDTAYLKLCSSQFSLDDLQTSRHISNYSIQKGSKMECTKSAEQFSREEGIEWNLQIAPKIEDLVFRTLKSL